MKGVLFTIMGTVLTDNFTNFNGYKNIGFN